MSKRSSMRQGLLEESSLTSSTSSTTPVTQGGATATEADETYNVRPGYETIPGAATTATSTQQQQGYQSQLYPGVGSNPYGGIQQRFSSSLKETGKYRKKQRVKQGVMLVLVLILCMFVAFCGTLLAIYTFTDPEAKDPPATNIKPESIRSVLGMNGAGQPPSQQCAPGTNASQKRTFPDLDYIAFGYNILAAYPLAFGHDPGFTHPIFEMSYEKDNSVADCSYSTPDGVTVVRDVSCSTTFNSETISTSEGYDKALQHSAGASFGGFGFDFSANGEYKSESSMLKTHQYVFVLTQAKCQQFFAQVSEYDPPRFHRSFLGWLVKLNNTQKTRDYLEFISYFGTHFFDEMSFGARFVNRYSMTTDTFHSMQSKHININAQASFHALFWHVGAHYSFTEDEKKEIRSFAQSVSTKTITMGTTPPMDLNATRWAQQVFTTPVPISYKLTALDQLFTDKFMIRVKKELNINYRQIRRNLLHVMRVQHPREVFDRSSNIHCRALKSAYKLPSNFCPMAQQDAPLFTASAAIDSRTECHSGCLESHDCLGASYGSQLSQTSGLLSAAGGSPCNVIYRMDTNSKQTTMNMKEAPASGECNLVLFPYKLSTNYGWSDQPQWLWLNWVTVQKKESVGVWSTTTSVADCERKCTQEVTCVAVSVLSGSQCGLFTAEEMHVVSLKVSTNSVDKLGFLKIC